MVRLTKRDEFGNADIIALSDIMPEIYAGLSFSGMNALTDALNRLAEYEDTGMTPQQFVNAADTLECVDNVGLRRVFEIVGAEAEGRLLVLPCKVGDMVYVIDGAVREVKVASIHQWSSGHWKFSAEEPHTSPYWKGYELFFADFGKVAFLTREDAEAALRKGDE